MNDRWQRGTTGRQFARAVPESGFRPGFPPHNSFTSHRYPNSRIPHFAPRIPSPTALNPPLAMVPMTRSRRRDQQILAQTGFGPSTILGRISPGAFDHIDSSTPFSARTTNTYQYRPVHRRTRQRPAIPGHIIYPPNVFSNTDPNTHNRPAAAQEPSTAVPSSEHRQMEEAPNDHSVTDFEADQSMIIVCVDRDGQSARVLADSHNSARCGRRVPSLQQDLGGIMDPDECTICKGSWSWIKGRVNGEPQTSPADWRLARLPCKHTYHEECLARWFLISTSRFHSFC